jgi:hypothetical protein
MGRRIATIACVLALALLAHQGLSALHQHGATPAPAPGDPATGAALEIACAVCASAVQLRSCAMTEGPAEPLSECDTELCREPASPPRLRELRQTNSSPRSPPDLV